MTANTLALVLIRLLAIKFLVETITEMTSQIPMLRMMRSAMQEEPAGFGQLLVWTMSILIVSKVFLGILLLIYSRKIADRIIDPKDGTLETHPKLAPVLTHVGIILIGLSALIYNLPRFAGTALQWFQAHASQPEIMATQHNGAMAQTTLLIILACFFILRGQTLTRWVFRLSK